MRILLVNGSAYPTIGGVENSLNCIGSELIRLGHEVKIFCFQLDLSQPLQTKHNGIEIIRAPLPPIRWPHLRAKQQLAVVSLSIPEILETFKPDMVWS